MSSTITNKKNSNKEVVFKLSAIGTIPAFLISYALNQSIGWCILHGLFGWVYIAYWAITEDPSVESFQYIIEYYKQFF